jgi:glycosyltransferase involved in cell wall biosynthesis
MRIAFLSPFYPYRGGIAQFGNSLYVALEKAGLSVRAYTFKRLYPKILFPGKTQFADEEDLNRNIPVEKVLDSINPGSYKWAAKFILGHNPEILLISYWLPLLAYPLGKVAQIVRKQGVKIVPLMHNVIPHEKRPGDILLTKYFCRNADGFILLNESSKADLMKIKPGAEVLVHQHPLYNHYGEKLDMMDAREALKIPLDKKVLLFFGFIRDYKGLDLLIKAMNHLSEDYFLVIAGECYGNFDNYRKIITETGLGEKVQTNIRYIPDREIPYFFSAADVCVLPYKSGTQSGVTGIAYHFDIPVIVTNVGGLHELIEDEKTGLITQPDVHSITGTIKSFFENNCRLKFQPFIRIFRAEHSWEKLADATDKFCQNILSKKY